MGAGAGLGASLRSGAQAFLRALSEDGVAVDQASDAEGALRRFSPDEHDLLLLGHDDAVPEAVLLSLSREIQALRARLREDGRRPLYAPILLVSLAPEAAALSAARLLGVDDLIGLQAGLFLGHNAALQMMCSRVRAYLALAARGPVRGTPTPRAASGPAGGVSGISGISGGGIAVGGGGGPLSREVVQRLVHDVRNPLAGLSSNLAYLEDRLALLSDDEEVREALSDSRAAVARLRRTASMLLDLGPLEEGSLRPRRSEGAVEPLVQEVLHQRRHEARLRDQELRCDVPLGLSAVFDGELLQRLLHALLDHALRYAQSKTPVVVQARPRDGRGLVVRLSATGEWLPHIERLLQARPAGVAEVGLGLHYVVLLARAHGGPFEVSGAEGLTTVQLLL